MDQSRIEASSLAFNVASLMRSATGTTAEAALGPGPLPADETATLVEGNARLLRTNRGILATVHVCLELALECSRCLEPLRANIECAFDEEFLPVIDVLSGAKLTFEDGVDAFRIDEHHTLDLTEALRQYRIAAAPIAAVCSETCRGLCATCGAELNIAPCSCDAPPDPRWAKLEALIPDPINLTEDA